MVSLLACGLSTATNSTPDSMRVATKARFRESRSSLAMTSRALCLFWREAFQLVTGSVGTCLQWRRVKLNVWLREHITRWGVRLLLKMPNLRSCLRPALIG